MPSWYPTKENPINGSFFKEQAEVLSKEFNIFILFFERYSITPFRYLMKKLLQKFYTYNINKENPKLIEINFSYPIISNSFIIGKIFKKIHLLDKINKNTTQKYNQLLLELIKKDFSKKPDIIYAVTAQIKAEIAKELATEYKIPYIVAEHCPFPLPQTAITNEIKKSIEDANCVISISRDKTRQMLIQGLQITPILVGNMVDEDIFTLPIEKKDTIFTIIIVAAYNFYKDYNTFFNAMKKLREITNTPFKILIVGFCPNKNKSIWNLGENEFKNELNKFGLVDICELVPSASRSEMPSYYQKSDVFVMTSIQEGFPVSSLEATSCGLPVYSTRCGGVEDFIDEKNGKIVDIQDYEQLALHLKNLIENKITYDAKEIRENTIRKYGKKAFLEKMTSIFNKIINEYV